MNRRDFLTAAGIVPALFAASTEDGFTSLFDGKTLDAWSVREGPESAFYVKDGAVVVHEGSNFPTWLRSQKQYENFDFRCEYFIQGWMNSGIYLHAPEHGRNTETGIKIAIFQQHEEPPRPESMGSIFPLIPPRKINVKTRGEWNTLRIVMDWPRLQVWTNDEQVQDVDLESVPALRHRLRRGYLGIESLSYPNRFRNLRVRELPAKEKWQTLYDGPEDLGKWWISDGKPKYEALGRVLRGDGLGYLATKEKFRDFELQLYIRGIKYHNGGVLFRTDGHGSGGKHYEIQLHDVEGAHYPTGSLYSYKRGIYPRIEPEKWYLMQLIVKDRYCLVRINGEDIVEYDQLQNLDEGHIELQAHQMGRWLEYKQIKIKRL